MRIIEPSLLRKSVVPRWDRPAYLSSPRPDGAKESPRPMGVDRLYRDLEDP